MAKWFPRFIAVWAMIVVTALVAERFVRIALLSADEPRTVTARGDLSDAERASIAVFEAASPSVVYIFTRSREADDPGPGAAMRVGTGSGFVWDAAGHIVTNNHVVQGAARVGVRFESGETASAVVVGAAPDYDLAVLRLREQVAGLQPIAVGRSDDLRVGQGTFAIGNPFGLNQTLTTGVISALDRHLPTASQREIAGVIQTDAAINPGNSGGPLLDSAARLIGVNTAILSQSGVFAGIGFAIPVDIVNRVVPQLIRDGRVPTPGIGILAADEEFAARLGVEGVIVVNVQPGSPADRAGLRGIDPRTRSLGDVITHVDGRPVRSIAEFAAELARIGVGRTVDVTVLRDGSASDIPVTVTDISS